MWYYTVHIFFKVFFNVLCKFKVTGTENLPIHGSFIIAANHSSYMDPPVISAFLRRPINFMAKKELFDIKILGPVITSLGAFPVERDGKDTAPLKHAISLLKKNKVVGIFPEGQRVRGDEEREGAMGVSLIAKQAKCPIVPVAIVGMRGAISINNILSFRRPILRVVIGESLSYERSLEPKNEKENMRSFTDEVMNRISSMVKNNE